jgi:hypothetical protein
MRSIGLGLLAGLILLPSWAGAEPEKNDPHHFEGNWEAPVSYADRGQERKQTLAAKDGRMVWFQPRQEGDKEKKTSVRLEAEYTVSKSGRVYAMVVIAGGNLKADEGDTFSFVPVFPGGQLRLSDIRGTAQIENILDKICWERKP